MQSFSKMASALLVLGILLFSSNAGLSPVFGQQQPQTDGNGANPEQDQAGASEIEIEIVDPVNQTEAEEVLDNVEEANRALFS